MAEENIDEMRFPELDENANGGAAKGVWLEPKLTFVEPKLISHGKLTEVTGQFFGGFTPGL